MLGEITQEVQIKSSEYIQEFLFSESTQSRDIEIQHYTKHYKQYTTTDYLSTGCKEIHISL